MSMAPLIHSKDFNAQLCLNVFVREAYVPFSLIPTSKRYDETTGQPLEYVGHVIRLFAFNVKAAHTCLHLILIARSCPQLTCHPN